MNRSVCCEFQMMTLSMRTFLKLSTKEPYRLLIGHIFQALLPMWQLNLSVPIVTESLIELFERTRYSERND